MIQVVLWKTRLNCLFSGEMKFYLWLFSIKNYSSLIKSEICVPEILWGQRDTSETYFIIISIIIFLNSERKRNEATAVNTLLINDNYW